MIYKVMVKVWANDYSEYFDGEYSGISHITLEAAVKELKEAKSLGYETWIIEE